MDYRKIKMCCYKILPLVYDESLSYYEVLCKITKKVNELIDVTEDINDKLTEIVGEAIEEWLKENLGIPFYNVTYYGVQPDSGDVYLPLHTLMKEKVSKTGGIVYFPPGKYTVSYTVWIPQNTIVCGAGAQTEFYFDETDTYLGVGLCNAGSNVTIENMKLSQASTGTFSTGAQAGVAGFSSNSFENVNLAPYEHRVIKGDTRNFLARNLIVNGKYALQTENAQGFKIENVKYENIYAPLSCVSCQGGSNFIENVIIENVTCDLLRVLDTTAEHETSYMKNISIRNVDCNSLYIRHFHNQLKDDTITLSNVTVNNSRTINNDYFPSDSNVYINGNASFTNCNFYGRSANITGVRLFNGMQYFDNCLFDYPSAVAHEEISYIDYPLHGHSFTNCTFINKSGATATVLIGYGHNNNIANAYNINLILWGDLHKILNSSSDVGMINATGSRSYISAQGSNIKIFGVGVMQDNYLFEASARLQALPIFGTRDASLSGIAFSSADPTNIIPFTYYYDESTHRFLINANATVAYQLDRFIIDSELFLQRDPTPGEIRIAFR